MRNDSWRKKIGKSDQTEWLMESEMETMKKNAKIFMIITLLLCVVLFLEKLTGPAIHVLAGILFFVLSVRHYCLKAIQMKKMKRSIQVVHIALVLLLILMFVSGMLIHPFGGAIWIKCVHKLSGVLFVAGILAHVIQHCGKKKKGE